MRDRRGLHLDLAALGLLVTGLLVSACVVSHQLNQAPARTVYPPGEPAENLFGALETHSYLRRHVA